MFSNVLLGTLFVSQRGSTNEFDRCFLRTWRFCNKEVVLSCDVALTTRSQWKGCSDDSYGRRLTQGWVEVGNYKLGGQVSFVSSMKG
jgi:hypothetical protein